MTAAKAHTGRALLFLAPFLLYEDLLISVIFIAAGLLVAHYEKISAQLAELDWGDFIFFTYLFHMLYGERNFAYVGLEPLYVTEMVLAVLALWYARDLLEIRKVLAIYYIIVLIGLLFAAIYFFSYRIDAIRDSLMLIYAFWVPVVYHIFRREKVYDLFFVLLKLFIVLKAVHYVYEIFLILAGIRTVLFEGFRFGVGYIMPSVIVISLFLPLKHIDWKYKLLSLMMFPAVFTMFHRSMFLGIALAAVLIFLFGGYRIKRSMVLLGVAGLALLTAFVTYYSIQLEFDILRYLERKSSMEEGNINFRLVSWQLVLQQFYDHALLGFGVGRPAMYVYANVFYDVVNLSYFEIRDLGGNAQPHNSYINILTRFGIFVFPLFLYAIFKPLGRFTYFYRKHQNGHFEAYSRFLLMGGFLLFMYVWAFFNVVLEAPHHAFPFWLIIGMLISYSRTEAFSYKTVRIKQ
jgi:O-antigen ligase